MTIWTEQQKINMLLLLDGWEERAEQRNKKRQLAAMGKKEAVRPRRKYSFKKPNVEELLELFFSKFNPKNDHGCIEWSGAKVGRPGHGYCTVTNRNYLTHRMAWIIANGAIPAGLDVCHHCDNPPCGNPDHLFLGTQADNMRDCKEKGRNRWISRPGESNPTAKLTNRIVRQIRSLAKNHTHKSIAYKFGITRPNVGYIVNRKTWKHI